MVRTLSGISATAPRHHVISWGERAAVGIFAFSCWLSPMVRRQAGIAADPVWHHVKSWGDHALAFLRCLYGPLEHHETMTSV